MTDVLHMDVYAGGWHCTINPLTDEGRFGAAADPAYLVAATVAAYQALPQFERAEVYDDYKKYRRAMNRGETGEGVSYHMGPDDRLRVIRGHRKNPMGLRRLAYKVGGREFDPCSTHITVFFTASINDISGSRHA